MVVKYDKILDEVRESDVTVNSYPVTSVSGDGLLKNIPAGNLLDGIVFLSQNANDVVINLGLTAGADDIYSTLSITGNQSTFLRLDYNSGKALPAFDVYISSALWNGAVLNCYLVTTKIFYI